MNVNDKHVDEVKDEPIRVAQIMGKLWAGGVEMVVFNYYRSIDKNKVQFDFFYDADSTVEPPQELIDMGARFYKIPPYQKLAQYIATLRMYFRKNKYQIVHAHINTLCVFPLFAAWTCKVPVRIAHNHSVPSGKEIKRDILKYFLRIFAKVFPTDYFACSEKAGRWMWGNRCFDKGNVFVLKNAVDFERFTHSELDEKELKKELNLEGKLVVANIGRFTFAKNHKFLIKVFKKISKLNPNAVLMLVGDGELNSDIHHWVIKEHLQKKVLFVGQVSCPERYYSLADVIVIPSIFEGLSLTAIESQISGVPVIASMSVPEEAVISDGCIRLALDNKDWAAAILKLAGTTVHLDSRSEEYNICSAVKRLQDWYEMKVTL